jgi:hypothetical protein
MLFSRIRIFVNTGRVNIDGVGQAGRSELRSQPSLVLVDNLLPAENKNILLDGLGGDSNDKTLLGEGLIEIDLVGCDVLKRPIESQYEKSEQQWSGAGPDLITAIDSGEKRLGKRYEACDVQVSAKLPGFFVDKKLLHASLMDFSQDGIGLICNERFPIDKKVKLRLEFSEGAFFDVMGVVVRSELSALVEGGYLNGIRLDESAQSFKDCVLEEGVRRKLGGDSLSGS